MSLNNIISGISKLLFTIYLLHFDQFSQNSRILLFIFEITLESNNVLVLHFLLPLVYLTKLYFLSKNDKQTNRYPNRTTRNIPIHPYKSSQNKNETKNFTTNNTARVFRWHCRSKSKSFVNYIISARSLASAKQGSLFSNRDHRLIFPGNLSSLFIFALHKADHKETSSNDTSDPKMKLFLPN